MRIISYSSVIIVSILLQLQVNAQADSIKNKTQLKIGVYYNSHLNYYGRTDSLQSNAVFPMAEIWFNNKFYINAAPVFVNNAKQNMDYAGTVATAGYQFNDLKKWAGKFYVVKPFYKTTSGLVQSALKAQISSSLSLRNKIITLTVGGDMKFSNSTDFGAMAGLDHVFRFQLPGKLILVVDPSAYLNAGTQQFVNTYYKKNNFLLFPGTEQQVSETVKKFEILSYEFSVPVIFAKNKFQILLIPSYVMPENLIVVKNKPELSEHGKNILYITIGAKVIF